MKRCRENIPGITIKTDIEDFSIIPFEPEISKLVTNIAAI
jgi:phage host-nuclease inhibitor protein Gam